MDSSKAHGALLAERHPIHLIHPPTMLAPPSSLLSSLAISATSFTFFTSLNAFCTARIHQWPFAARVAALPAAKRAAFLNNAVGTVHAGFVALLVIDAWWRHPEEFGEDVDMLFGRVSNMRLIVPVSVGCVGRRREVVGEKRERRVRGEPRPQRVVCVLCVARCGAV